MRDRHTGASDAHAEPDEVQEGLTVTHIAQRHEITPTQVEALIKEHDAIRENLKAAVERAHAEKE